MAVIMNNKLCYSYWQADWCDCCTSCSFSDEFGTYVHALIRYLHFDFHWPGSQSSKLSDNVYFNNFQSSDK